MKYGVSIFPSLHHRKEGWLRGQQRSREATLFRADGVVFLFVLNRKTTPASRSADASRNLFSRSATPPCGDARRGIRSIPHSFTASQALGNGLLAASRLDQCGDSGLYSLPRRIIRATPITTTF